MRYFNYFFDQKDGISKANWHSPSSNTWRQDSLPFFAFRVLVEFCPRGADQNQVMLRIGNWKLTIFFSFIYTKKKLIYVESLAQEISPYLHHLRSGALSIEDVRRALELTIESSGITTEQVIENIKQLTGK
jgi:hypothetical protein